MKSKSKKRNKNGTKKRRDRADQKKLEEINEPKNDCAIYKDFIILCKKSNIAIPIKIKEFIISDIEKQ